MIIAGSICLSIFVILAFASYKYWRYRAKRNGEITGKNIITLFLCLVVLFCLTFTYVTTLTCICYLLLPTRCVLQDSWKSGLEQEEISGLTFFEMNTIRAATDNFKISNKLGEGGFGPVYKVKRYIINILFYCSVDD